MTRGRTPWKAIGRALAIAAGRGIVRMYERGPGTGPTFTIRRTGRLDIVAVNRLAGIDIEASGIEAAARAEIADLRLHPSCPEISREVWGVSKQYFIRFFRVLDAGIVELDESGEPLPAGTALIKNFVPGPVRFLRRRMRGMVPAVARPRRKRRVPAPELAEVPGGEEDAGIAEGGRGDRSTG